MTPEQRQELENQIKNTFSEEEKKLANLKQEIQIENDADTKSKKESEIQKLEADLNSMKKQIETLQNLAEDQLKNLKDKLESIKSSLANFWGELWALQESVLHWNESKEWEVKQQTPSTYELLKGSETYNRLRDIIAQNQTEFKNIPWETAEKQLEYIFQRIRRNMVLFLENTLGKSESIDKIINNTIAPAFEWNLMTLLRDQWNETNVSMLKKIDNISRDNFTKLLRWVSNFATKSSGTYLKLNSWMNALDYLALQKDLLFSADNSEVLVNPIEFNHYLNNELFSTEWFSPYASITPNKRNDLFKINYNQTFEYWLTSAEQQVVLNEIWNIQVAPNARTTSLIVWMLNKPEQFLSKVPELQQTVNAALDTFDNASWITKIFWVDIIWEISKEPEARWLLYKVMDFVCKLLGFSGWLEWIIKKWRLDRMDLDRDKILSIKNIMSDYQEKSWGNKNISIIDQTSCNSTLLEFQLSDLDKPSSTRWDFLRDAMVHHLDITSLSPAVVQATLWNDYVENQTYTDSKGKQRTKKIVKTSAFDEWSKLLLAHKHVENMKNHLWIYKDLSDFYKNVHTIDDLAVCMATSLYCNQNDVIKWITAHVFMPETYYEATGVDNSWFEVSDRETHSELIRTSTEDYPSEISSQQETKIQEKLQSHHSPITLDNIKSVAVEKWIPSTYLAAVIENDSSSGTAWKWAITHNPWNVWNTDSWATRTFATREDWLRACADVISDRISAYKSIYTVENGKVPPIWLLLANQWPDWKWFLSSQWNYKQDNPYRDNGAPLWAYMTATNWPKAVESIVESYA